MKSKVKVAKTLLWDFDGKEPYLRLPIGRWEPKIEVDPFPCYSHKKELVEKQLEHVVKSSWDIGVTVFIGHYEAVGRTNAWATENSDYDYDAEIDEKTGRYPVTHNPYIFLLGKRIPPHPAVTRYLVAHEYGHCVDYHLNRVLGLDNDGKNALGFREAYRKMRGVRSVKHYGGGTWHKCGAEVLACDFRVLVCNTEPEYWPHDGIEYPDLNSSAGRWWSHLLEEPEEKWRPPCKNF